MIPSNIFSSYMVVFPFWQRQAVELIKTRSSVRWDTGGQGRVEVPSCSPLSLIPPRLRSITSSLATGALRGDRAGALAPQHSAHCLLLTLAEHCVQAWPMHIASSPLRGWNIQYGGSLLSNYGHACMHTSHLNPSLWLPHNTSMEKWKMVSLNIVKILWVTREEKEHICEIGL